MQPMEPPLDLPLFQSPVHEQDTTRKGLEILHQVQSPYVYRTLPHITRCDDTSQVFTLYICILEAIEYCRGEG